MQTLPDNYRKNGYEFNLIERNGDVAIYEQIEPITQRRVAYEVFEVMKYPERVIAGQTVIAREGTPSNEMWGQFGFTIWSLDDARQKKDLLTTKLEERIRKRQKNHKTSSVQDSEKEGIAANDKEGGEIV